MKFKTLVLVGASLLSTTMAFVMSRNGVAGVGVSRRTTARRMVLSADLTRDVHTAATSTPPKARDIWIVLSTRYGASSPIKANDWTKTRNYIYHTVDKLPISQVENVCTFLETHFDDTLVVTILQSSPRILRKSVTSNLIPTTKFLKKLYGDELFQKAVSRNPDLLLSSGLGYNGGAVEEAQAVEMYLRDELQMSKSKIQKLQQSAPFFFQIPLAKIQQVTEFLTQLLDKGDQPTAIVTKVMANHPRLFHLSVDANLQPRMEFLKSACQLSDRHVATLIKSSSGILGLSVQDNLKPTLDYLADLFIVSDDGDDDTCSERCREALHKCIMSHPAILALSRRNIETKVDYFNAIDGRNADGFSLAARIALRSPVVYSLSMVDNIIPTVEFLSKVWGTPAPPSVECRDQELCILTDAHESGSASHSDHDDSLGALLRDYPSVLTLSLEGNLQPTMHFYNATGYTTLTEDWQLVSSSKTGSKPIRGRYIAASLFHRLLPRWHYFAQTKNTKTATKPPLHAMVGATDPAFCKVMALNMVEYLAFKQESAERLKFSSQFDTWLKTGRAIDV